MIIGETGDSSGTRHRGPVNVTVVDVVVVLPVGDVMPDSEDVAITEFFDFSSTPMSTPASI